MHSAKGDFLMSDKDQNPSDYEEEDNIVDKPDEAVKSKWEAMAESSMSQEGNVDASNQAEQRQDEVGDDEAEQSMSDLLDEATTDDDILVQNEGELLAAQKRIKELEALALLAKADAENIKRRSQEQVEKAHKFALEKFISELLPVIDSLERGLQAGEQIQDESTQENHSMLEGMQLTHKLFLDTIAKFGVVAVNPLNEKFNPDVHNAVSMIDHESPENTVVQVLQPGYTLNGRLVRPAMVVIAKA